ncbi:uncharacterized protein LY79DRAFT_585571 [Colletotrichum navitas]|uniref:Uncharacterized protein n=1 Tax=Colletotrichum navitas TaxID=681940 RepID=A0AAD8PIB1_9PEZI|nr:uncharacterized protein LY79DRAFT_585571 [Colletotrichum navitas]KAK1561353.1 hypothetical protein LY79DRAFT_585571 [Colletotrichum navitas]
MLTKKCRLRRLLIRYKSLLATKPISTNVLSIARLATTSSSKKEEALNVKELDNILIEASAFIKDNYIVNLASATVLPSGVGYLGYYKSKVVIVKKSKKKNFININLVKVLYLGEYSIRLLPKVNKVGREPKEEGYIRTKFIIIIKREGIKRGSKDNIGGRGDLGKRYNKRIYKGYRVKREDKDKDKKIKVGQNIKKGRVTQRVFSNKKCK